MLYWKLQTGHSTISVGITCGVDSDVTIG